VEGSLAQRAEKRDASSLSRLIPLVVLAVTPFVLLSQAFSLEEHNRTGFSAALNFETLLQV